ncbi:MAG: hypothetical protein AB1716_04375 [Planctomycetota bacterium]
MGNVPGADDVGAAERSRPFACVADSARVAQPAPGGTPPDLDPDLRAALAALSKVFAAWRDADFAALRAELAGVPCTERQFADVVSKVRAARAAEAYLRLLPWGGRTQGLADVAGLVYVRLGRRVRDRQLREWRAKYAAGGARALLDTRGRPARGGAPVAPEALLFFCDRVAEGCSIAEAHRRTRGFAEGSCQTWPRSLRTVRAMLADGRIAVQRPRRRASTNPNEYLVRGVSRQ